MHDDRTSVWRIVLWPFRLVIGIIVVFDEVVGPLYRPLARFVASLGLIVSLERAVARQNRFVILALLAVPLAVAEPAKILGLLLLGQGRLVPGFVTIAGAYLISLLLIDRIYHAGREKLMTIAWFAAIMSLITRIRDALIGWARATGVWRLARDIKERVKLAFSTMLGRRR